MANQAAVHCLSRPGTEILVHEDSHIANWEKAGISALSGAQPRFIRGAPRITRRTLDVARREPGRDGPRATLCCFENTHAAAGGMVTPLAELEALTAHARIIGLAVHLDGARLWNASAATSKPAADFAATADLTMVSYSKGLGAPVGSALAGSRAIIEEAWEARQRFGGGMRQSGIVAAGALYGLEHNLARLADDHANALHFSEMVAELGVRVVTPETNIIMMDLPAPFDAVYVAKTASARGVRLGAWTATRLRAVTHLDVSSEDLERAAAVLRDILSTPNPDHRT